jgi:hypothetical protein
MGSLIGLGTGLAVVGCSLVHCIHLGLRRLLLYQPRPNHERVHLGDITIYIHVAGARAGLRGRRGVVASSPVTFLSLSKGWVFFFTWDLPERDLPERD